MTNYADDFNRFWLAWPGRWHQETRLYTKAGKYEAFIEWKRLSAKDKVIIIRIVESGKVKDAGTQYLPDACRWLHRKRWEDY